MDLFDEAPYATPPIPAAATLVVQGASGTSVVVHKTADGTTVLSINGHELTDALNVNASMGGNEVLFSFRLKVFA